MDYLIRILIEHLVAKGVELNSVPAFIRDLATTVAVNPDMSLPELNRKLHLLGWDGIELDDFTLQLVLVNFQSDVICEPSHYPKTGQDPEKPEEERGCEKPKAWT